VADVEREGGETAKGGRKGRNSPIVIVASCRFRSPAAIVPPRSLLTSDRPLARVTVMSEAS